MPRYKVIAEQKIEFLEIEAKDSNDAIDQVAFLFDEAYDGDPINLFTWKAVNEDTGEVEEVQE